MKFTKGKSGNPSGKPKGALNGKTKEQISRARRLAELIESDLDFEDQIKAMPIKEKMILYKDLLEYLEPKLSRVEHTDSDGGPLVITVRHSVDRIQAAQPEYLPETAPEIQEAVIILNPDSKKPF